MSKLIAVVFTSLLAAILASCDSESSPNSSPPMPSASATSQVELTVDRAGTAIHLDTVGAAALVSNAGRHGARDIELSIEFFAGEKLVLTLSDVLAFCPAGATCPWATSFGVTDDDQRAIDSAEVAITAVGPTFDTGVVRPLDLRIGAGSMAFDLPPRPGVAILYVVRDDAPYFGLFTSHQIAEKRTLRLTDRDLPIGPQTRGVFYEGHIPNSMLAGGD
jgi:hypothetical protein